MELGCGIGACGLLCSRLAAKVLLTDGEESTLDITRENVRLSRGSGQEEEGGDVSGGKGESG